MSQSRDKGKWREEEATIEIVKQVFTNPLLQNCLLIDLLGGEPLLVKDLEEIVSFLSQRGHMTNMVTNGILLKKRIRGLKEAGITRINISLYEENKKHMESDLQSINEVFRVHTSMVLQRSLIAANAEEIISRAHFVRDAGARSLRFFIYRPVGASNIPEEVISDVDLEYRDFQTRLNELLPGFCIWPAPIKRGTIEKRCAQLWQRVDVDMKGRVFICCGSDNMLEGENSNLFEAEPSALFDHPTWKELRGNLMDPTLAPPELCKDCNLLGDPGW
jgi:organic radical activating enzyme|tara:strand:+ start:21330 stop:22154 length:825 start_codon:yes stop_codon:yes gene_type:complete